jgi:hypothetical protein
MGKPIYQLFVINNNIAANHAMKALSEAERKALWDQEQAAREAVGGTVVVLCNSAWADEAHPYWGVVRFPDLQARIAQARALDKIGWWNYFDAFTLLGTSDAEPEAVTLPNPIYKLWIVRNTATTNQNRNQPKGLEALVWEKHNALHKETNSQGILTCSADWCNEAYLAFGISVYPDLEAHLKVRAGLEALGWSQYFEAQSYLGIKAEQ